MRKITVFNGFVECDLKGLSLNPDITGQKAKQCFTFNTVLSLRCYATLNKNQLILEQLFVTEMLKTNGL
jgi:hypothetical protein